MKKIPNKINTKDQIAIKNHEQNSNTTNKSKEKATNMKRYNKKQNQARGRNNTCHWR